MTEQGAAPAPEDTIKIGDDNNNDEWAHGQDKDDDNILLPRPARLKGCEKDPEEESLFSNKSDNDNDDNYPNDDYSKSSDGADKKKKSKRKTPTITIHNFQEVSLFRQDITCRARGCGRSGCNRR